MKSHLVSFGNYLLKQYNVMVHSTDGTNQPLFQREVSDADIANWEHENPDLEDGGVPFKAHTDYPSRYKIGEKVKVFLMPEGEETFPGINATIIAVHFTLSKVKYDVEFNFAGGHSTRMYNIDSILVKDLDYGKEA
jgi:hypothetical protein